MITVVTVMLIGIALGYLIRNKSSLIAVNDKLIIWAIYFLLLILGISIGSNETIIKSLPSLGLKAIAITLGGVIGSIVLAWFVYLIFFKTSSKNEE